MNRLGPLGPAFAIPVGVTIVVFLIVFGYSRVLLALAAVSAVWSTTAAILAALVILGVCTFLANRPGGNAPPPR